MHDIRPFMDAFRETGSYRTPAERLGKLRKNSWWTSFVYNVRGLGGSMGRATWLSHLGKFHDLQWQECGLHLLWETERMGTEVIIEGFENLKGIGPAVVVGNHMSLYETFACPALVRIFGDVAIVLKESLMKAPLLGQTFATRKMIPVSRKDPKADLKAVLTYGERFLREDNTSVLLYPQGTRQSYFDCRKFNTLGVKLAQNAGVPVVPIAAQTAFLGVGRYTKDFGPVDTSIPVRFACGPAIQVTRANAKEAQAQCVDFIASKLEEWGRVEVRR